MDEVHYLYLITRDDGATYIGVTNNIQNKMAQHKIGRGSSELKNRTFVYQILEEGGKQYMYSLEELKIKELNPSLNKAPGGYGGSYVRGSQHWNASLTENEILKLKAELIENRNINYRYLSTKYNTSESVIEQIASNKTWKHVGPEIPPRYVMLKDEELQEKVKQLWCVEGKTNEEIGTLLGVHKSTISRITKNLGPKNKTTKNFITEETIKEIRYRRTNKRYKYSQIANELNIPEYVIGFWCRKLNIPKGEK